MDIKGIFSNHNEAEFLQIALDQFKFQANNCFIYKHYIENLSIAPETVKSLNEIPFLPIDFFKQHKIISGDQEVAKTFTSSGTTGSLSSFHHITDISIYEISFRTAFQHFYGDAKEYAILALLPSYLERSGSSLIYMVNDLIKTSKYPQSDYFLYNHEDLFNTLNELKSKNIPTILFGVTYALLDFSEKHPISFPDLIVIETGGMKGRRREMIREELHDILNKGFGVSHINSEYGMTELLSQAYSKGMGQFQCPPWMKVLIREVNDPFTFLPQGKTGGINIIDLANINSCSFIATQDLGKKTSEHDFEVLGRFDQSDVRGCNLLIN